MESTIDKQLRIHKLDRRIDFLFKKVKNCLSIYSTTQFSLLERIFVDEDIVLFEVAFLTSDLFIATNNYLYKFTFKNTHKQDFQIKIKYSLK